MLQFTLKEYISKNINKQNYFINGDEARDENIKILIQSMNEYVFKMLNNFSKIIEDKVSEIENKLGSHIKLLNSKLQEMEAKLNLVENKTKKNYATFDEIWVKSNLRMKNMADSKLKIEKAIQEINSKVELLNKRLKNQESNNLYQAKTLQTSIIRQSEHSNIAKYVLIDINTKECIALNNENLNQKKIEKIKESLSSIDLSNRSSSMLRLRSKYIKAKAELKQLKLDISKIIELILNND